MGFEIIHQFFLAADTVKLPNRAAVGTYGIADADGPFFAVRVPIGSGADTFAMGYQQEHIFFGGYKPVVRRQQRIGGKRVCGEGVCRERIGRKTGSRCIAGETDCCRVGGMGRYGSGLNRIDRRCGAFGGEAVRIISGSVICGAAVSGDFGECLLFRGTGRVAVLFVLFVCLRGGRYSQKSA